MNHKIICIICPKSCEISVISSKGDTESYGNDCSKGKKYAINEVINPRRVFTSTVIVNNASIRMLPVRTDTPIKKNDWKKARELINNIEVVAPIKFGQIIVDGFLEKNIKLIATREI